MNPGREDDDHLITRSASGDRLAFTRLVQRHQHRVMAMAARICGDRSLAEDIVQEVFIRAWQRAPDWRAGSGVGMATYSTWLCRIAVNLAIDETRRKRPVPLSEIDDPADRTPCAVERIITDERRAMLEAAIANLPERQRAAIALTCDAELSNAEAARALGASVGALELLLVRARRTLREAMMRTEHI